MRLPDGMPQIQVSKYLRPDLAEFSFDRESYADALSRLGMPEPAIGTLRVRFSNEGKPRLRKPAIAAIYEPFEHSMTFYPRRYQTNLPAIMQDDWSAAITTLSDATDALLAHESKHATDMSLRTPEAAARIQATQAVANKVQAINRVTLTGIFAGTAIGELSHVRMPLSLASAGGVSLRALAMLPLSRLHSGLMGQLTRDFKKADEAVEEEATKFTRSVLALFLFSGLVKIELTPPKEAKS